MLLKRWEGQSNGKITTSKSVSYKREMTPLEIGIKFNNQEYNKIKRTMKDDLACALNKISGESLISKAKEEEVKNKYNFDIENSKTNIYLSKLICTRIEEDEYLQSRIGKNKTKKSVIELKKHLTKLKEELKLKQNLKKDSRFLSQSSNKITQINDQKLWIDDIAEKDLLDYISKLHELKSKIKSSKIFKPDNNAYIESFNIRRQKLVKEIDLKGIELNDTISELEPKLININSKISKTKEKFILKEERINNIENECQEVDHYYNKKTELIDTKLYKYLQKLGDTIKEKQCIKNEIEQIKSNILELKINSFKKDENNEVNKVHNYKLQDKLNTLLSLNSRLSESLHMKDRIVNWILQAKKASIVVQPNEASTDQFNKSIKILKHSLQETNNEKDFLNKDIDRLNLLLDYSSEHNNVQDLNYHSDSKLVNEQRAKNIAKLKDLINLKISLNFEIFSKHNEMKKLEAIIDPDFKQENNEIKSLIDKNSHQLKTIEVKEPK